MTDFLIILQRHTLSCNKKQHSHIRASDCVLGKRPIQIVKRMFHQGHLSQASLIPVKFHTVYIRAKVAGDSH